LAFSLAPPRPARGIVSSCLRRHQPARDRKGDLYHGWTYRRVSAFSGRQL